MRIQHYGFWVIVVVASLAIGPSKCLSQDIIYDRIRAGKSQSESEEQIEVVPVLEVGALPFPRPSRRQIIDADKGEGCLACHRLPYPTAPQKPEKPRKQAVSPIKATPPGGWRLLTAGPERYHERLGEWSPDGKWVIFSSTVRGNWDILLMQMDASMVDANTNALRRLTDGEAREVGAAWSPDGSRILFWSWRTGNPEIFLVRADGSGMKQLTSNLAWDMFPAWSPDGRRIAFDSDRMGNFDIWVKDVDSFQEPKEIPDFSF